MTLSYDQYKNRFSITVHGKISVNLITIIVNINVPIQVDEVKISVICTIISC